MKKWIKAARLRTLPLSLAGIVLAGFIAGSKHEFNTVIFILSILTAALFQILSNFANDYGDGVKGTDNENRIGPERAIQSGEITPEQMKKAMLITAVLSFISAIILVFYSFGTNKALLIILYLILGLGSIVAAVKYTVGNKAYGYYGLGDLFVFLFFGLVSVIGGNYLYTKTWDWTLLFPAFSIGLLSIAVLNLNNMRDLESDRLSGKNTIPVKLGLQNAKKYHIILIVLPLFLTQAYIFHHLHSVRQWLFMIPYLFLFIHLMRVIKTEKPQDFDPELKKVAILTFLYALFFGFGLVWG
jgi:1,4-dihydroxy-2-naphthoate octaprenyltransferase